MKKASFLPFAVALLSFITFAFAEAEEKVVKGLPFPPGPGMEVRKVGGAYIYVPKDAVVEKKGTVLYVEGSKQYSARRFLEMDGRLGAVEVKQEALLEEIGRLNKAIEELKKASTNPE